MSKSVKIWILGCLPLLLVPLHAGSQELETLESRIGYAMGVEFGLQINQQLSTMPMPLDTQTFISGIRDVLTDQNLLLNPEQREGAFREFQEFVAQSRKQVIDMQQQIGAEFMAQLQESGDFQSTEGGVLYRVVREGDGEIPTMESSVVVHYRGTLIDGAEFDSSYARNSPATFGLNGIIPGWQEALTRMPAGSEWMIVVPPELAYGDNGVPPTIPPGATLIFSIELLEVK